MNILFVTEKPLVSKEIQKVIETEHLFDEAVYDFDFLPCLLNIKSPIYNNLDKSKFYPVKINGKEYPDFVTDGVFLSVHPKCYFDLFDTILFIGTEEKTCKLAAAKYLEHFDIEQQNKTIKTTVFYSFSPSYIKEALSEKNWKDFR